MSNAAQVSPTLVPATKFLIPSPAQDLLVRGRLLDQLGDARPLTLVVGLAASGKTSLLTQWAEHVRDEVVVAWLTADPEDASPSQLGASILRAVSTVAPIEELGSKHGYMPDSPSALAATVVNSLLALDRQVAVVIDDGHLMGSAAAALVPLIERLPANARVIVATRSRLPLRISRMRSRGLVLEIGEDALAATPDDLIALAAMRGHELSKDSATALVEVTEGWIGSLLTGDRAFKIDLERQARDREQRDASRIRRGIAEALVRDPDLTEFVLEEVAAGADGRPRRDLLELAVLDEVTLDAVSSVLGRERAKRLGVGPDDATLTRVGPGEWRMNQMVRFALERHLWSTDADRARELHQAAAKHFASEGDVPPAVRHLVSAGRLDEASGLVGALLVHAYLFGLGDELERLRAAIDFGAARADESGHSQVVVAATLFLAGHFESAREWLTSVDGSVAASPDAAAVGLLVSTALHVHDGDTDAARAVLERLEPAVPAFDSGGQRCVTLLQLATFVWTDQFSAARRLLHGAEPGGWEAIAARSTRSLAAYATVAAIEGELDNALLMLERLLGPDGPHRDTGNWRDALRCEGLVRYERGEHEEAERVLQQATSLPGHPDGAEAIPSQLALCRVWLATGRPEAADTGVREIQRHLPTANESVLGDLVRSVQVRIALQRHELEVARSTADAVRSSWRRAMLSARVDLATDRPDDALSRTEGLQLPATARASLDWTILRARVQQRRLGPKADEVRELVEAAVTIAQPQCWVRPFFEYGPDLLPAVRQALKRRSESPFHQAMRAEASRAHPPRPRAAPTPRPERPNLGRRELAVLRMLHEALTIEEISARLFVSKNTLKTHLRSIYRKLGVHSRAEAVVVARRRGLISRD